MREDAQRRGDTFIQRRSMQETSTQLPSLLLLAAAPPFGRTFPFRLLLPPLGTLRTDPVALWRLGQAETRQVVLVPSAASWSHRDGRSRAKRDQAKRRRRQCEGRDLSLARSKLGTGQSNTKKKTSTHPFDLALVVVTADHLAIADLPARAVDLTI